MSTKPMPTVLHLLDPGPVTDAEVRRIVPTWQRPSYLAAYDPEVGIPSLVCTIDIRKALRMETREAFDLWHSSPADAPLRPDGRPNRPLTAFTIEFVRLDHAVTTSALPSPNQPKGVPDGTNEVQRGQPR